MPRSEIRTAVLGQPDGRKAERGMKARINRYAVWTLLMILCIFQYGIQRIYGFTVYPDEFGYWASAAEMAGYDWSEVASIGPYYSFGYSLILFPILKVFGGGIAAYRAAIFVNVLLMCASLFMIERIIQKIFPDITTEIGYLLGGAAVLYPAWIFYMQMTMSEAVLFFVFVLDVYLFLAYTERRKTRTAVALALSFAYGYCVHMRTVGIVIAGVLALLGWLVFGRGKKRGLAVGFAVLLTAGIVAVWLKDRTIAEVYTQAAEGGLANGDYGGQIRKLARIFTLSGMWRLVKEMIGKLYYLGISSFGMFYWGLGWCLKECMQLARDIVKSKETRTAGWTALFLLLSVMGQTMISSIFMYDAVKIDGLIYGRYNELLVPVLAAIGLAVMLQSRRMFSVTALIGAALGGMTLLLLEEIEQRNLSGIRGWHVPGISYLLLEENVETGSYMRNTWILGFGIMLLVCVCVWVCRRRRNMWWLLSGILVMEIAAGLQISSHYTYKVNNTVYRDLMIPAKIKEYGEKARIIWYLDEGTSPFVDLVQLQIPDRTIYVMHVEELADADSSNSMMITARETEQSDMLEQMFHEKIMTNHFCLYYN